LLFACFVASNVAARNGGLEYIERTSLEKQEEKCAKGRRRYDERM
jgi:hypothetical protein